MVSLSKNKEENQLGGFSPSFHSNRSSSMKLFLNHIWTVGNTTPSHSCTLPCNPYSPLTATLQPISVHRVYVADQGFVKPSSLNSVFPEIYLLHVLPNKSFITLLIHFFFGHLFPNFEWINLFKINTSYNYHSPLSLNFPHKIRRDNSDTKSDSTNVYHQGGSPAFGGSPKSSSSSSSSDDSPDEGPLAEGGIHASPGGPAFQLVAPEFNTVPEVEPTTTVQNAVSPTTVGGGEFKSSLSQPLALTLLGDEEILQIQPFSVHNLGYSRPHAPNTSINEGTHGFSFPVNFNSCLDAAFVDHPFSAFGHNFSPPHNNVVDNNNLYCDGSGPFDGSWFNGLLVPTGPNHTMGSCNLMADLPIHPHASFLNSAQHMDIDLQGSYGLRAMGPFSGPFSLGQNDLCVMGSSGFNGTALTSSTIMGGTVTCCTGFSTSCSTFAAHLGTAPLLPPAPMPLQLPFGPLGPLPHWMRFGSFEPLIMGPHRLLNEGSAGTVSSSPI